jgi:peptidoglycan hydrolase-like protein with peptidoglycan-binding domain
MGWMICLSLALGAGAWAAPKKTSSTKKPTKVAASSKKKVTKKRASNRHGSWRKRGQQTIATERATEIQEALIREGYLSGQPTGTMDERTKAALVKYQQENGWQGKIVPDSRALIKLGLGPKHDNLLNPSTAAISAVAAGGGNQ